MALETRIQRLEAGVDIEGLDPLRREIRAMSEEELDERIAQLRAALGECPENNVTGGKA